MARRGSLIAYVRRDDGAEYDFEQTCPAAQYPDQGSATGFGLNVKMGRCLIYSAALSDANRLNVEAYLDNWRTGAI